MHLICDGLRETNRGYGVGRKIARYPSNSSKLLYSVQCEISYASPNREDVSSQTAQTPLGQNEKLLKT